MKKRMVANMTAVGSFDRAERAILKVILLGIFFANPGRFCGQGASYCEGTPFLALIT